MTLNFCTENCSYTGSLLLEKNSLIYLVLAFASAYSIAKISASTSALVFFLACSAFNSASMLDSTNILGLFLVTSVTPIALISSTVCIPIAISGACLLYTSDAADEEDSVDLGGRRIIKK